MSPFWDHPNSLEKILFTGLSPFLVKNSIFLNKLNIFNFFSLTATFISIDLFLLITMMFHFINIFKKSTHFKLLIYQKIIYKIDIVYILRKNPNFKYPLNDIS
jgi:hypothetical protein